MNKPYFEVGEEVTLQSKDQPESNGDYVIYKILKDGEEWDDRLNPEYTLTSDGVTYVFEEPILDTSHEKEGTECLWCESALRKKYKPSELSFNELISEIKCPRLITQ